MSARLRILVPDSTRNYVVNPSARYDTTYINAVGSTVTRTLDHARFGVASYKVVTNGAAVNEGFYYRTGSLDGISDVVTVSAYVLGTGEIRIRLIDNPSGGEWKTQKVVLDSDRWTRIEVSGRCSGSNDVRLYIETADEAQAITFYVDGLQMERKSYSTTYCDGDQPGCRWNLMEHNSQSTRSAYTRQGGRWIEIAGPSCEEKDLYTTVVGGMGMPPIRNQTQPYADAPGDFFQSAKTLSRVMTLTFHAKKKYSPRTNALPSLVALHELRQQLLDVIKPDRTAGNQAFLIEYRDGEVPLYMWARYDGGLEGDWDVRNPFINSFPLRLLAVSPYWFEDDQKVTDLNFRNTQTVNYALQRVDGVWSDMNGGFDGQVLGFVVGPQGQIVAFGNYIHANHKAGAIDEDIFANFIAWWDGEKWNSYGVGANNIIRDAAFAPNGDLYVTGDFTSLLGVACNYVGYIDTSGVAHAMGSGLGGAGYAIAVSSDSDVYIGFNGTSAGGGAAYYIVRYDGSYHPLGANGGMNGLVRSIDITRDGTQVYFCGDFTDENSNPGILNLNYVALYEPLLNTIYDLGTGFDDVAYKVLVTDSGRVYAVGAFTGSGDANLILLFIAYWNGGSWYSVGSGADSTIRDLAISIFGNLLLGGDFTLIGAAEAYYAALYNDAAYVNLDVVVDSPVYGVALDKQENMFLAPNGTTAEFAAISTVDNIGSAETNPFVYITGPCTLVWLENQTTQRRVFTDIDVAENEELMIDFSQGTVISNTRGNLAYAINPGSDLRAWNLVPGENKLAVLMTNDVDATVHISYTPRHWSVDHTVLAESL